MFFWKRKPRQNAMVNIAHCPQLEQAYLLCSWLEACGITAYIPDEFVAQTAPQYLFASPSQIRVQVHERDSAAARAALAEVEKNPHRTFAERAAAEKKI